MFSFMFRVNKDSMTNFALNVNNKHLFKRHLKNNYTIDFLRNYDKVLIVIWTIIEKRSSAMITISNNQIPLDFDISLNDFFRQLIPHNRQIRSDKVSYDYQDTLCIKETIGTMLLPETLIYYPELCRQLRKLNQLDYDVSLNLNKLEIVFQKGLTSIIKSLNLIQDILHNARCEKAKLDGQVNNLICLYGNEKSLPILRAVKPYFCARDNTYRRTPTTKFLINIAGINYYLHYHGKRFGKLKPLFSITPHQILSHYFESTKLDVNAISPCAKTDFIGGIINTPIFAFRVRQSYRHRGKKYFINLANCQTYTRLGDLKDASRQYTDRFNLKLIKD